MTMTDPIADMLARLRNANSAYHETVSMPNSKLKGHIAEILKQEGYIGGFHVADNVDAPGRTLTLDLKYGLKLESRFCDHRPEAGEQARPARLREVDGAAAGARWSGCGDSLDLVRPAHRQAGRQAWSGRGSPRLRLVGDQR